MERVETWKLRGSAFKLFPRIALMTSSKPTNKCGNPGFNNNEDTFVKRLMFTLGVVWIYVSIGLLNEIWNKPLKTHKFPQSM